MCKLGDIIIVYNAKDNGRRVGVHPFLVLDDTEGIVRGTFHFDFVGSLFSSNQNGAKNDKLHNYDTNFPIASEDKKGLNDDSNNKDSFIELSPLYYFDKSIIKYRHLGRLDEEVFNLVIEYAEELASNGQVFRECLDNAKPISDSEEY